ncbi:MAG: hypothetical protein ABW148_17180 [Sedimenticola sp.]
MAPPKKSSKKKATEQKLAVDDQGIPILDEVVEFDSICQDSVDSEELDDALPPAFLNLGLPEYTPLVDAMREKLRLQLSYELTPLIENVVTSAITQATLNLETAMREELYGVLHLRLDEMIEQSLNEHFGDPNSSTSTE